MSIAWSDSPTWKTSPKITSHSRGQRGSVWDTLPDKPYRWWGSLRWGTALPDKYSKTTWLVLGSGSIPVTSVRTKYIYLQHMVRIQIVSTFFHSFYSFKLSISVGGHFTLFLVRRVLHVKLLHYFILQLPLVFIKRWIVGRAGQKPTDLDFHVIICVTGGVACGYICFHCGLISLSSKNAKIKIIVVTFFCNLLFDDRIHIFYGHPSNGIYTLIITPAPSTIVRQPFLWAILQHCCAIWVMAYFQSTSTAAWSTIILYFKVVIAIWPVCNKEPNSP